jgi:hypothetical protein
MLGQRDVQISYLACEVADEEPMDPLWGNFITYRPAVGPQAGRKKQEGLPSNLHCGGSP